MLYFFFERKILFPEPKKILTNIQIVPKMHHTQYFLWFLFSTTTTGAAVAAAVQIHYDDTRAVYIVCI